MTSRTPIRLTPHRGPLATPSTTPESSPISSTPPTDTSYCSTTSTAFTTFSPSALEIALFQTGISPPGPPKKRQFLRLEGCKVTERGLFDRSTKLGLMFEGLIYSACDLLNNLAWIVTFCLLIWGLLEWSSHASELPRRSSYQLSFPQFPLPSRVKTLSAHVTPSLHEPRDEHAAVLQFLHEQFQHAKALSSLSINLGSPLGAFFEAHRAIIPRVIVRQNLTEFPHLLHQSNLLANVTNLLDTSVLDFTSGGFIGRNFALALDELGDLISEPIVASHGFSAPGRHPDAHLHAIYWRTTSNLLLEYSAARPRAQKLSQQVHALHHQLSPIILGQLAAENIKGKPTVRWWKSTSGHSIATTPEDGMRAFVTGLEITLENIHRLIAYLDWITEQLAQTTLNDILKRHQKTDTDFASCLTSLQELFAQQRSLFSPPRKLRICSNDFGPYRPPVKIDILVPGSPTMRSGR